MKIAIEALGIHDYGGGRTATLNLIRNLLAIDPDNQYTLILNQREPSLQPLARNLQQYILPIKNRFAARLCAQMILPLKLRSFDLVHFAKNLGVFGMPIPSIVTMYDMTTLIHPELFPKIDVWYWKHIQKRTIQAAEKVIAISQRTKTDIQRVFQVDSAKISVIYPSISPRFQPIPEPVVTQTRKRYSIPKDYVLFVGRLDRKNNIAKLLEGFAHFHRHLAPDYRGKLVIVGGSYAKSPAANLKAMIEQFTLNEKILFTGKIPDDDLPAIYSGAQCAVLPSLHEGFGLVAIEAMACGTPLIAHRAGAISEIVEKAAILLDDLSPEILADTIHTLIKKETLRKQYHNRGLQQAQRYQNCEDAEKTLALYASCR